LRPSSVATLAAIVTPRAGERPARAFGLRSCGQLEPTGSYPGRRTSLMYIGIGTVVLIVIIILVVLFLRRA
jgi:hypothetical protein